MYSLIRKYEGCRLTAYKCPLGYWTIGYGNRFLKDNNPVKEGMKITYSQADELLDNFVKKEIVPVVAGMNKKFTDNQKEALYSLIFNVGVSAFNKSKLKQADYEAICREWDFGFVNKLKGLYKRRVEELYFYMMDV